MASINSIDNLDVLRVHIAPVGFEVDRIVIPLRQKKADRLWLLIHENPSLDQSGPYVEKIEEECRRLGVDLKKQSADRMDMFGMIRNISNIIKAEKRNLVYVNVASGSKIQAIACMMACMILKKYENLKPFYAIPEKYAALDGKPQSFGVKDMVPLPVYGMQIPKPKLLQALKIVAEHKDQRITKKEMAQVADDKKLITVSAGESNYSQVRYASLQNNIIDPLENQWKFVRVEKIGRNRWIMLTDEGRYAVGFMA